MFGIHDVIVPVADGRYRRTDLFDKHFNKGNVEHLFRAKRFSKQVGKEIMNYSFKKFCDIYRIPIPNGYRKAFKNLEAGFKSAAKYDRAQPEDIDEAAWALSGEWTKINFKDMNGSRVLGLDVCINDCKKTSSCGYPWNLKWHTKAEAIEAGVVESICTSYWDNIRGGAFERITPIFNSSQKVELRDVTKLRENKLRTFTAAPMEHSISLNRFCLDQNNRFYDSHNRNWSTVGCTKYLGEWNALYRRLARCGTPRQDQFERNAFELDESAFDSSLYRKAMYGQRDIRWSMLDPVEQTSDNKTRFFALYDAIVESVIILETGEVIRKATGNPSGSANTIVDNTMILFRLLAYAWILLHPERKTTTYFEFKDNVEAALCGDDNTFCVSDAVVGWFNATSVSKIWSVLGIVTTSPCYTPRPLRECRYLSQGFEWDASLNIYLPSPEPSRVLSALMWGSELDDVRWHLLRAHALRCDSYGNQELRVILQRYIVYLNQVHRDDLVGVCNTIPIEEIQGVWRSDTALKAAYTGAESKISGPPTNNNLLNEMLESMELSPVAA